MQHIGRDKSKEEIEDGHDGTELRSAVLPEGGVVDGEDDDVQEDGDTVDDEGEEDSVLAMGQRNAPDHAAKEQEAVDHEGLKEEGNFGTTCKFTDDKSQDRHKKEHFHQ